MIINTVQKMDPRIRKNKENLSNKHRIKHPRFMFNDKCYQDSSIKIKMESDRTDSTKLRSLICSTNFPPAYIGEWLNAVYFLFH